MVWVEWNGDEQRKARGREGKRRGRRSGVEFFVLEHVRESNGKKKNFLNRDGRKWRLALGG